MEKQAIVELESECALRGVIVVSNLFAEILKARGFIL